MADHITEHEAEELARQAFYGQRPNLFRDVRWLRGYYMGGQWNLANSVSLEETIETVKGLAKGLNLVGSILLKHRDPPPKQTLIPPPRYDDIYANGLRHLNE